MLSITKSIIVFAILGLTLASPSTSNRTEQWKESQESQESNESPEFVENMTVDICRHGCPRILDPICAVDEDDAGNVKYFHNQCLMEFDSCRRGRAWKPTQMLQCITDVDPVVRADCLRVCAFIYDPVCASTASDGADGKYFQIFGNRCMFDMEKCLASGKWVEEIHGELCGL